ncbi:hypothetical protein [Paenibacillus sp. OT2-17]|jgi:hypothetical protein|uniref:hypothetical protein n=1 Tax=Paenibacillus sp. OT2-17 TaxID=2691605 RepID=UPI001F16FD27|nr:hypothetical protein [Paenibacillus sp. OT2-17]
MRKILVLGETAAGGIRKLRYDPHTRTNKRSFGDCVQRICADRTDSKALAEGYSFLSLHEWLPELVASLNRSYES